MVRRKASTSADRPSLSRACARTVGLGWACLVIVAIATFAIVTNRLITRLTAQAVVERARICAASLQSSPSGELGPAFDRLQSRYSPLVAAASVGVLGDLQWVGEALPGYRRAARTALTGGDKPVPITAKVNGERETLWAVSVALNGSELRTARRVLFLFRHESDTEPWLGATTAFGCVMAIGSVVALMSLGGWLSSHLARPLASLARPIPAGRTKDASGVAFDTGGWRETENIAARLRELSERLGASENSIRTIRHDSEYRLRARERGFDRRLRRAEDRAAIDPLTGLRNRTYLDANLHEILATQQARDADLAVIMIDMDNFKHLNDTQGHKAGDELLRCTGELLRATVRPTDHAIRYGGDEFLLLLPGVDLRRARQITERILKLFAQSVSLIDLTKSVTLSAGIASRKDDRCDDGWQLISKADAALYAAKRKGKNAVAISSGG